MPRAIPSWPSLFTWFFIEFSSILQPFEPSKSWFFLRKNKVFSKNCLSKLASIFLRFWCQLASIFPPKIHSNRIKNRSWNALIFWSIFTSIFIDFWRIWPPSWDLSWVHVGYFFDTRRLPKRVRALKTRKKCPRPFREALDLDFSTPGPRFWNRRPRLFPSDLDFGAPRPRFFQHVT